MQIQPTDFSVIAQQLYASGALQPHHVIHVGGFGSDLMQGEINTRKQTSLSTLGLYMPYDLLQGWMHEYFAGPFLRSPYYKDVVEDICFLFVGAGPLDDDLTLKFNDPRRKRIDDIPYTAQEHEICRQVCHAHPEMVMAVLAFQSSLIAYAERLKQAVGMSTVIPPDEKEGAAETLERLVRGTKSTNILHHILPAIAIHYYKNHNGDLTAAPALEDFQQGMRFVPHSDMYSRIRPGKEGETVQVTCPAKALVNKASSFALDDEKKPAETGLGTGLYRIFQAIGRAIAKDEPGARAALQQVQEKISEELSARRASLSM